MTPTLYLFSCSSKGNMRFIPIRKEHLASRAILTPTQHLIQVYSELHPISSSVSIPAMNLAEKYIADAIDMAFAYALSVLRQELKVLAEHASALVYFVFRAFTLGQMMEVSKLRLDIMLAGSYET
ncbi:hypothetical protein H0H92_004383 [Tricholoma furcatifolium]|nr:hypothetical protein H0H92_004383 [Tricholoma furcatifolium]